MWESKMKEGQELIGNRKYEQAAEVFKDIIDTHKDEEKPYNWALKHMADLNGFLYAKDYMTAIDLYQTIISNYEGDDGLYEWCQIDMAKTYLLASMDMMSTYEDMVGFLEPSDEKMAKHIENLAEKREDFLMDRAEQIYKSRL